MLKNYLKIAYKVLLRQKFFTFVSLFGISITLTILFVVVAMLDSALAPGGRGSKLNRSLRFERITLMGENGHIESYPSYHILDRHVRSLITPEAVAIHASNRSTVVYVGGRKVQLDLKYTDGVFWDIVEFDFAEGRPYTQVEVDNVEALAVISERTRDEVFGKRTVTGEQIETTSGIYRIVGVVPKEEMPGEVAYADIWVPITHSQSAMMNTKPYGSHFALVLPREDGDRDALKAEFEDHLNILRSDLAGEWDSVGCVLASPVDIVLDEMFGETPGGNTVAITMMIALMVLFMLLPAMNLVNMTVSRIFERSSEIGVRKAFGASVSTLIWQFVVENVVLTLVGGVIAVVLSLLALDILNDSGMMPFAHFTLNIRVLIYGLLITLFFGVFSGVLPAYRMSRLHPVEALRGVTT